MTGCKEKRQLKLDNGRKTTVVGKHPVLYKVRKLRKQAHISQKDVADVLGITTQYYSEMERGLHPLTYSDARTIARMLHKPMEELFEQDFKNQKGYGHQSSRVGWLFFLFGLPFLSKKKSTESGPCKLWVKK